MATITIFHWLGYESFIGTFVIYYYITYLHEVHVVLISIGWLFFSINKFICIDKVVSIFC